VTVALRYAVRSDRGLMRANNEDSVYAGPRLLALADGMGTTLTALLFAGSRVGLVHVGDSRAYLVRGGSLTQITHDDTFVQALVDEGRLTMEEASSHPQRSLILHAFNGSEVEPDLSIREARVGDRYLVCSDGLSDVCRRTRCWRPCSCPTRTSRPTGWSSWPCGPAARTT